MKFYGETDDANSASPGSTLQLGGGLDFGNSDFPDQAPASSKLDTSIGKGSIDLGNLLGSIGGTLGNIKDFTTGLVGGIGIPGGPTIGDAAKLPGEAVDALGGIGLPGGGNLGGVAETVGSIPGFLEQRVEKGVAEARISGNPLANLFANTTATNDIGAQFRNGGSFSNIERAARSAVQQGTVLPPEFQARLDAGESVDSIAEDMAKQGVGFSNNRGADLIASMIFDPMNFLSFGVGKIGAIAKAADVAAKAGDDLGVGQRFMAKAYDAASRGLSAGGAAFMDKAIGPTTSGVFHALGTKPYFAIRNAVGAIAPEYASAFEDAFARGAAQLPRAVIARYMSEEAASAITRYGEKAASRLSGIDTAHSIEARLAALRTINPSQIERRTEELLSRTTPDFAGHTDEARFAETRDKLAQITGMSPEDAARALGGKANLRTAQQVHLAFYGKAGDDLARAKAVSAGAKGIDAERLTLIGDDTLTSDRAQAILSGEESLTDAVDRYSILRNKFGSTAYGHADVKDFVEKLASEDALPSTVVKDVTRKNPLPKALGDWRAAYSKFGYDIGFAPKDGMKTILDADGKVISSDPFVHFVSEADPLTYRNPLGRFMDSMFRGSTQTQIILDSRNRMVDIGRKGGISANESRAIHQRILQEAADRAVSPRGLSLAGPHVFQDIFRDVLGDKRYNQFIQKVDPDFAVMKAFEGNLSRVGITQKFTGKVKTALSGRGNIAAAISEGIYPAVRFRYSPLFQAQEIVESPFFDLLRGVSQRAVPQDVADLYAELSDLPDFKYLAEAGYTLNIAGANEAARTMTAHNTLLGKALSRTPNVSKFKERARVAQVFTEHGPAFEDAVNQINPKLWRAMTDAYGTTDPSAVADAFIKERQALTSGDLDQAMAVFDAAKPSIVGNDAETVWQAFRESFRQASQQAFKTHYFNPERGFLERTINHPYLGIYPASYMWGKVLPEFARFLLKRPFGLNAPLLGLDAYQRVQQSVIASLATDPDMQKWVDKSSSEGSLYLIEQLLPATPANLPANEPAWARHLSQQLTAHKKIDPQQFITTESGDTLSNAIGISRTISAGAGVAGDFGDLLSRLQDTARQLDAAFPRQP